MIHYLKALFILICQICAIIVIGIVIVDISANLTENESIWQANIHWLTFDITLFLVSVYTIVSRNLYRN